mmetsp:Transcript_1314/g.2916  ORF Transcript_1314/g.2916 Transcript_1314/m.2916 type:complete len:267 (-) Transcript_1314:810-1610(-)
MVPFRKTQLRVEAGLVTGYVRIAVICNLPETTCADGAALQNRGRAAATLVDATSAAGVVDVVDAVVVLRTCDLVTGCVQNVEIMCSAKTMRAGDVTVLNLLVEDVASRVAAVAEWAVGVEVLAMADQGIGIVLVATTCSLLETQSADDVVWRSLVRIWAETTFAAVGPAKAAAAFAACQAAAVAETVEAEAESEIGTVVAAETAAGTEEEVAVEAGTETEAAVGRRCEVVIGCAQIAAIISLRRTTVAGNAVLPDLALEEGGWLRE